MHHVILQLQLHISHVLAFEIDRAINSRNSPELSLCNSFRTVSGYSFSNSIMTANVKKVIVRKSNGHFLIRMIDVNRILRVKDETLNYKK